MSFLCRLIGFYMLCLTCVYDFILPEAASNHPKRSLAKFCGLKPHLFKHLNDVLCTVGGSRVVLSKYRKIVQISMCPSKAK